MTVRTDWRVRPYSAERNAEIIRLHVTEGLNLTEIGERYGITRERVRQIVRDAGQPSLTRERQRLAREAKVAERARRRVERAAKPYPHGTRYGYDRGCSCDDCRRANVDYMRSLKGRTPPKHGTESAYRNYGCRCEPCKQAGANANARGRSLRIARGFTA